MKIEGDKKAPGDIKIALCPPGSSTTFRFSPKARFQLLS